MFFRDYPETGIEDDMEKKPKVTAQLSQTLGEDPANYVAKVSLLLINILAEIILIVPTSSVSFEELS